MFLLLRLLDVAKWLVIVDALLSWVMAPDQFPRSVTHAVLAPIYDPIHRAIGARTGPIDLAPLLVLGVVFALQLALRRASNNRRR